MLSMISRVLELQACIASRKVGGGSKVQVNLKPLGGKRLSESCAEQI